MTELPATPFQPAPPPVSPSSVERPARKSAKKAAKPKKAKAPKAAPAIDYAAEAKRAAKLQQAAADGPKATRKKKRKVKITAGPAGSMAFYERTGKLIAAIAEHTGADPDAVVKMFKKLMPE